MNLAHRIVEIISGKSGTVVKVEPAPLVDSRGKPINYPRDDFKNEPQLITIITPAGREAIMLSPLEIVEVQNDIGEYNKVYRYKEYKVGYEFP